jgi:hypothetical protein
MTTQHHSSLQRLLTLYFYGTSVTAWKIRSKVVVINCQLHKTVYLYLFTCADKKHLIQPDKRYLFINTTYGYTIKIIIIRNIEKYFSVILQSFCIRQ